MEEPTKRCQWSDIRLGIFTPEPLFDMDEHWVEVGPSSDMMCYACKRFPHDDPRRNSITENRTNCLNCASTWTRLGTRFYEAKDPNMDEHAQDAKVPARLLNIYNECLSWRGIHAEDDLRKFLVTASMAMLSGYPTAPDAFKQVPHRSAIRMPAYMIKGKCRRNMLQQLAVQREHRAERLPDGTFRIRWHFRLWWDGGNVAYHDYMKTVLAKDEFLKIFPQNASAEHVGDMFEFWLRLLELGVQVPTMFRNWGESLDNCLAGLEESFWLFSSSCRHGDTSNTRRNRTKKAHVPQIENAVVAKALEEAGVFKLLEQSAIT